MTLEITDRTEFKDKFAALMASNVSLITAGLEPSRDLSDKMIDEFLNQFTIATLAPAPAPKAREKTIGSVIRTVGDKRIMSFGGKTFYSSGWDALTVLTQNVPLTTDRKDYEVIAVYVRD